MPLEYSERATIGLAELYKSLNDRTIFIEDANGRLLYERLVGSLVGAGKIKRIFPLKGREAVVSDWLRNRGNKDYIYIIDGDLDPLLGRDLSEENLIQLDHYCIENVVIDSDSATDVVFDYVIPGTDMELVREHLDILLEDIERAFLPIFVLFAVSRASGVNIPGVSESGMRYFTRSGGLNRKEFYRRYRALARQLAAAVGRIEVRRRRKEIVAQASGPKRALGYISGKSVILPIIHKYAEWNLRYVGSSEVFLNQASRHKVLDADSRFGRRLRSLLEGSG